MTSCNIQRNGNDIEPVASVKCEIVIDFQNVTVSGAHLWSRGGFMQMEDDEN